MAAATLTTDELLLICDELSAGKSLRGICRDRKLPESSVRRWLAQDAEAMAHSAHARELGCDALADECIEIADGDGEPADKRIRIDTRIRLIGKWSQRYSDKVAVTGSDGGAIKHDVSSTIDMTGLSDEQLRALASIRVPSE